MFWSQAISLQMQPSPFDKRYYATQNCIENTNAALFTGQKHKYGCHSMLYYHKMKTQWLLYCKFTKALINICHMTHTHVLVSVPEHVQKCSGACTGAVSECFWVVDTSSGRLISLLEELVCADYLHSRPIRFQNIYPETWLPHSVG